MNLIDRFTRDRVSRYVWGGLALVCLLMFVLGRVAENRSFARTLDDAQTRSLAYANLSVAPYAVEHGDPPTLRFSYRELSTALQAEVFTDANVARVRAWAPDGTLLYSSDDPHLAGQVRATDVPGIDAALQGNSTRQTVVEPFTFSTIGTPPVDTELLQVYSPLRAPDRIEPAGAVEVDFLMRGLRGAARGPWPTFRLLFGALFLLCATMFVVAIRRPAAAVVGAGVAVPTTNGEVPAGTMVTPSRVQRLKASGPSKPTRQDKKLEARLERLERALVVAEERAASFETQATAVAQAREAEVVASEQERQELERRVEDAAARALALEASLEGALAEAEAAKAAAERAKAEADAARAAEEVAAEDVAPTEPPNVGSPEPEPEPAASPPEGADPLAELEARLEAAERRAGEAQERLAEVPADAADLRARLARTAARKKGMAVPADEG